MAKILGKLRLFPKKLSGNGYTIFEHSHHKSRVSSGCFPIYVGEEHRKYVIPVKCLSSARFQALLNQFKEEMVATEPITLPCSPKMFEVVLNLVKAEKSIKI